MPDIRTVLAVLGLLFYAVLRIAYSVFYNKFGLSPDDLGLGYLDLLVESAVGTSVLLLVVLASAFIFLASYVGLGEFLGEVFRMAKGVLKGKAEDIPKPPILVALAGTGAAAADFIGLHGLASVFLLVAGWALAVWMLIRGCVIIRRGVRGEDVLIRAGVTIEGVLRADEKAKAQVVTGVTMSRDVDRSTGP